MRAVPVSRAGSLTVAEVEGALVTSAAGLDGDEVARRRTEVGPNAVRTHQVNAWRILAGQLRSPLLVLLAGTAVLSVFLGNGTEAVIIAVILTASVGLGFANEYRAARAAEALHRLMRHTATVVRGGRTALVDVVDLVPGDVVRLDAGQVVPADVRLVECAALECDESVLTGESMPVAKEPGPVPDGTPLAALTCCAMMGTVVHAGWGTGVVVATGSSAEFGRIALELGEREPETAFQVGLRDFSGLLLKVALVLTGLILVTNLLLHRSLIDSLLFSLAIAVGMTPQLLPAVVSTSLAIGSRRLAAKKVLVKRMVCIEDLGDLDVVLTDKTGTLTEGRISFVGAVGVDDRPGAAADRALAFGRLAVDLEDDAGAAANPLDAALTAATAAPAVVRRLGLLPFDSERRMTTVLVDVPGSGPTLVSKGAPESLLVRCVDVPPEAAATMERHFRAGDRLVAVASRPAPGLTVLTAGDEQGLCLAGFLVFLDKAKATAGPGLQRLAGLGIEIKVVTGDNPLVAEKVGAEVGLVSGGTLLGADLERMDDAALPAAASTVGIFARVTPEQKARLVRAVRGKGRSVGFLGDGVNDALALHAADVGISVDTGTEVAKDAADIILLEKDLDVLADGVAEGRRIFANTLKYVLMGTSSNFGNMFSAAAASAVLPFLPMLPGQILLNNLLYDTGQLSIPTDRIDPEQARVPAHWDVAQIRRFMLFFGPLSSLFDFLTFAVLLGPFHAGPPLFRTGWFVESMATQVLVIFVIRTRRTPFWRSRAAWPLTLASFGVVAVATVIPYLPFAGVLGFVAPPAGLLLAVAVMAVVYLALADLAKRFFYAELAGPVPERWRGKPERIHRRASRFSHAGPVLDAGKVAGASVAAGARRARPPRAPRHRPARGPSAGRRTG
jgi:Mg2+-importing ATPase